jgi:hypothetical protein
MISRAIAGFASVSLLLACGADFDNRPASPPAETRSDAPSAPPAETTQDASAPVVTFDLGLDPSKSVQQLTDEEKGQLCDRWMGTAGGYNVSYPCDDGRHMETPRDQAECVARSFPPTCTVTVGEIGRCIAALMPSRGCALGSGPPPECEPLASCSYRRRARFYAPKASD